MYPGILFKKILPARLRAHGRDTRLNLYTMRATLGGSPQGASLKQSLINTAKGWLGRAEGRGYFNSKKKKKAGVCGSQQNLHSSNQWHLGGNRRRLECNRRQLQGTDGGWKVTDGGWSAAHGGWRVTDGGWSATDGNWRVIDGDCKVTDGGWRVSNGGWSVTDGG